MSESIQEATLPMWRVLRNHGGTAESLLSALAQNKAPIDVFAMAQAMGVHVHITDADWDGALKSNDVRADVWISEHAHRTRQRFTLAHELGHLMLHPLGVTFRDTQGMRSPQELEANTFAAELLMPEWLVLPAFRALRHDLTSMSLLFEVSEQAMGIRLGELFDV